MKKFQCCLVLFSSLLLILSAAAQVQNGQFTGTVTDQSDRYHERIGILHN